MRTLTVSGFERKFAGNATRTRPGISMKPPLEPMTLLSTVTDAELLSCALAAAANPRRSNEIRPTQYLVALCEQCVGLIMVRSACFELLDECMTVEQSLARYCISNDKRTE